MQSYSSTFFIASNIKLYLSIYDNSLLFVDFQGSFLHDPLEEPWGEEVWPSRTSSILLKY